MNRETQERPDYRLAIGLFAGAVVGAALTMWFAPHAATEIRDRLTGSAKRLGKRANDQYQQASSRVTDAVDHLTRKVNDVRDDVADAVGHGAHEVERFAAAAKSAPRKV